MHPGDAMPVSPTARQTHSDSISHRFDPVAHSVKSVASQDSEWDAPREQVQRVVVGFNSFAEKSGPEHLEAVHGGIDQQRLLSRGRQPIHHEKDAGYRQSQILKGLNELL